MKKYNGSWMNLSKFEAVTIFCTCFWARCMYEFFTNRAWTDYGTICGIPNAYFCVMSICPMVFMFAAAIIIRLGE